jgi:ADP-dependent phosphofructokinase/glucokinase
MNIQDRLLVIEQTVNAGVDTQGVARILELMGASALSTEILEEIRLYSEYSSLKLL